MAEEVQVFLGQFFFALQIEHKVRSCRVGGSVALGSVRPVDDIVDAVFADDDVARTEIAVADLVVLGHTL